MPTSPLNIAALISGSGRTLQNFLDEKKAGRLDVDARLVIASRAGLVGSERALAAGLNHHIVDRREFANPADASKRIFALCDEQGVDLVCLAGWLSLLYIPDRYANRVINIHPSLLPSFGGRGMYGHKVHQAVIDYGCKVSGCTVHLVNADYDNGPVVLQRTCPVLDDDTADALAHRVFEEEKIAYPEAIRLFHQGRLKVVDRKVRIT